MLKYNVAQVQRVGLINNNNITTISLTIKNLSLCVYVLTLYANVVCACKKGLHVP